MWESKSKRKCSYTSYYSAEFCTDFKEGTREKFSFGLSLEIAGLKLLLLENETLTFCWISWKSPKKEPLISASNSSSSSTLKNLLWLYLRYPSSSFYPCCLAPLTFKLNLPTSIPHIHTSALLWISAFYSELFDHIYLHKMVHIRVLYCRRVSKGRLFYCQCSPNDGGHLI